MDLILIGAGGFAQTVADIASQTGKYENINFLDDNKIGDRILGKCSDFSNFIRKDTCFYPAIGNNEIRLDWLNRLQEKNACLVSLIHPSAYVSPTTNIGLGTVILPKSVINTNVTIGNGCIINCGAIIDHDCIIEDGVHICLGAIVKGENKIKSCRKVEAGEIIQRGSC